MSDKAELIEPDIQPEVKDPIKRVAAGSILNLAQRIVTAFNSPAANIPPQNLPVPAETSADRVNRIRNGRSEKSRENILSRRGFIRLMGLLTGAITIGKSPDLFDSLMKKPEKKSVAPTLGPLPKSPGPFDDPGYINAPPTPERIRPIWEIEIAEEDLPVVNNILNKRPSNGLLSSLFGERAGLEKSYVNNILSQDNQTKNKLTKIDTALMVVADWGERNKLVKARYRLRQEIGHPKLQKLDLSQINWAKAEGIDPEVLGICLDIYPKAIEITDRYFKSQGIKKQAKDIMLNPGGLAKLMSMETSNLGNLGSTTLPGGINNQELDYQAAENNLAALCQFLLPTGLIYKVLNIPVSERGDPSRNISGGALGTPQFMPERALWVAKTLKEFGLIFNPFNPNLGAIGTLMLLAINRSRDDDLATNLKKDYNGDSKEAKAINNAHLSWQQFTEVNPGTLI